MSFRPVTPGYHEFRCVRKQCGRRWWELAESARCVLCDGEPLAKRLDAPFDPIKYAVAKGRSAGRK